MKVQIFHWVLFIVATVSLTQLQLRVWDQGRGRRVPIQILFGLASMPLAFMIAKILVPTLRWIYGN